MTRINVPTREEVSPANQAIFDNLKSALGMVPNLYATLAHSEHALGNYLALQNGSSSITGKAREVVNLVVSQVNKCEYCLAAHTALGKMNGFTDEQILEIRVGSASFDKKVGRAGASDSQYCRKPRPSRPCTGGRVLRRRLEQGQSRGCHCRHRRQDRHELSARHHASAGGLPGCSEAADGVVKSPERMASLL